MRAVEALGTDFEGNGVARLPVVGAEGGRENGKRKKEGLF